MIVQMGDYLELTRLEQAARPNIKLIVAGVFCLFISAFLYLTYLLVTLVLLSDPKRQVIAPGEAEIYIAEPGRYTIFHEYRSVFEGERYFGAAEAEGLVLMFTHESSGVEITPRRMGPTATYSSRDGNGISIYEADLTAPGTYRVESWYEEGAPDQKETVLAIRRWHSARAPLTLARGWAVLLIPVAFGVFLIARGVWGGRVSRP